MGRLQTVDGHLVLFVAHLEGEVLVRPLYDKVGTLVRGLEGGLPCICPHKDKFCLVKSLRDIGLGRSVCTCWDGSEVSNLFSEGPEMVLDGCLWSVVWYEVTWDRQG